MQIQRKNKKQKRRMQQNTKHTQLLQKSKSHLYYDQAMQAYNMEKYYSTLKVLSYNSLHQLVKDTYKHAKRRQNLFPIIDRHPDYTLRCVYSGNILCTSDGTYLQKCDEEHSFPQSFQRGSKSGTGRDMHAIFAAGKSANGCRGNMPFGGYGVQIDKNQFGSIYRSEGKKYYTPKINSGAIARASLYVLLAYKNCANENYLPKQCLKWLINQCISCQVTLWQKHRNQQLYRLQGNRNPFIDYPKWSTMIDFTEGWQN